MNCSPWRLPVLTVRPLSFSRPICFTRLFLLTALLWPVAGAAAEEQPGTAPPTGRKPLKIVAFGDSTTAPRGTLRVYAELLAEELPRRGQPATVINAGVGGNTTVAARTRFQKSVLAHQPDVVVIQFGINDSAIDVWKNPPATTSRVARQDYLANLRFFIQTLKKEDVRVILMTPNPLRWTPKLKELYGKAPFDPADPDGFNLTLKEYAAGMRELAKDEGVTLLDIDREFRSWKGAGGVDALLLDGMHPGDMGQRIVAGALIAELTGNPAAAAEVRALPEGLRLHPGVQLLPEMKMGPFVRLRNGHILTVERENVCTSSDEGRTWTCRPLVTAGPKITVSNERALLQTRDGVLIAVFMNLADRRFWKWDAKTNTPSPESRLNVWSIRSTDGGKTWGEAQTVMEGYCGAIRDMIQTRSGRIVVPVQPLLHDKARHATRMYVSDDEGQSWRATQLFDAGGRGHHDGALEGTLTELKDGRLWLLLRTNHDDFYSSYSRDDGETWSEMQPAGIGASSAPAMLKRQASGRLMLIWNQLYPEGRDSYRRMSGQYSEREASWHREELSIAFSSDDGQTWSKPVVVARKPGTWLSYPYLFEASPGTFWLTTMQGGLRIRLNEQDFVSAAAGE